MAVTKEVQDLVAKGKMGITNSYFLEGVPLQFQNQFLKEAETMKPNDFAFFIAKKIKKGFKQ